MLKYESRKEARDLPLANITTTQEFYEENSRLLEQYQNKTRTCRSMQVCESVDCKRVSSFSIIHELIDSKT